MEPDRTINPIDFEELQSRRRDLLERIEALEDLDEAADSLNDMDKFVQMMVISAMLTLIYSDYFGVPTSLLNSMTRMAGGDD